MAVSARGVQHGSGARRKIGEDAGGACTPEREQALHHHRLTVEPACLGSSLQPYAAVHGFPDAEQRVRLSLIDDARVRRTNLLCSLSEDELSPAALATRVVVVDCVKRLIGGGAWPGTRLWHHED